VATANSSVHSTMMEKSAQPSDGGVALPPRCTLSSITYKGVVHAPAERADTLRLLLLYLNFYSVGKIPVNIERYICRGQWLQRWANTLTYWSARRQRQYFRPMIESSKNHNFSKNFSKRFKPKHQPKSRHLFAIIK
jgi:hypothetical protein